MVDAGGLYLHKVFTFAAGAGALMLASGAPASDAVEAALDVTRKAGLENMSADVTYTEFRLSYNPEKEFPYTRIEPIGGRTFDYGKLTDLSNLAPRYGNGELAAGQAMAGDSGRYGLAGRQIRRAVESSCGAGPARWSAAAPCRRRAEV